ncbi:restriction endonuclease subunit S [Achromobacter insuavis]|uniref:restriction endonuclease subunit S n=1 Tax=Achromobacter insuavis TaxID=1287735 RepID=UPI001F13CB97|nr:restriction endonuclease subunit S [Achromobacter insuavis]
MTAWEIRPLAEVCAIKPPKAEARARLASDREVSFAPMDVLGIDAKFMAPTAVRPLAEVSGSYTYFAEGDVLVAKITPCFENGKLGIAKGLVNGVGFGSSEFIVIRPGSKLDREFLYYYLYRPEFREVGARTMTGAVGHKRVAADFIEQLPIPIPPILEQRRIVAILDEAFDAIATAKANTNKNLRNAHELFDSHLQTVFTQGTAGWSTTTVRQLVHDGILMKPQDGNHGEIHPTRADYVDAGVPFIMAADLVDGKVDTQNCRFIADTTARGLRIGFAKTGDVLLSHKGTIGRVAILESNDDYVVLTPQVTYYRTLDDSRLFNGFLYYCLRSPRFQSEMNRIAGAGSTRAYIGITRQLDLQIDLPPIVAQHELVSQLRHSEDVSSGIGDRYVRKLAALEELKKSLLHQAFTGKLTAKNTDKQLEAVA